ncbi:MAG: serine/threonine protein kinase [Thermodesulfobacteriota bacterium]|nr:serine/threonine protein kinase [Thermodesulfobacteriota bacterium]
MSKQSSLQSNLPATERVGRAGLLVSTGIVQSFLAILKKDRRIKVVTFLVLLGLVGLGSLAHYHTDNTLREMIEENVGVMLNVEKKALNEWIRGEKEMMRSWTNQPFFRQKISRLTESLPDPADSQRKKNTQTISAMLHEAITAVHYTAFLVAGQDGRILAAYRDSLVGTKLNDTGMAFVKKAFLDETFMTLPQFPKFFFEPDALSYNLPVIVLGTGIKDANDKIVATLLLSIPPEDDFSELFSMLRFGSSGDCYAFNKEAVMVSQSRWTEQAAEQGLLLDNDRKSSILNIKLTNPAAKNQGEPSLTKMASKALSGQKGFDLEGYRDYRGVEVIGAWDWIDEFQMGIAIEVEKKDAYRILLPLRLAQFGLILLLAGSTIALLFSSYIIQFLKGKVDEVIRLGQYRLIEKIGEGGMGTVYLAKHAMLQRSTAIKLLKQDTAVADAVNRFEREVQLTCRLNHPNTVAIYDYGRTAEGQFYYVMEYIDGLNMADLIEKEGPLPACRVVFLLRQICASLAEAHDLGLIHRDIKPLNVMVTVQGGIYDQVKVLDFGMVKDIGATNLDLDATQVLQGTPTYIAPERINDPAVADARTDIYSIGTIAFNALSGEDVFTGSSAMQVCVKVLQEEPRNLLSFNNLQIPESLAQLVQQCLAKNPDGRPQSVKEIMARLDKIKKELPAEWDQGRAEKWWKEQ